RGGSFKIRGASNFIFSLSPAERRAGVVAYSSGNHAQAVAIAAEWVGIPATLVMPEDAPRAKLEATRAHGARIVTYDRLRQSREEIGRRIARETGAALVPPYDHPRIIAGQGTVALELLAEVRDLDALVVPIGGGGLISGCSIAAHALRPGIRIFGVEPETAADTYLSLQAGRRVEVPNPPTIADGLRSPTPGEITFPVIREHVEEVLLVSEREIRETVKFLLMRMKILAEPSGAVAAAAVLYGKLPAGVERAGVVLSGGNVDFEALAAL
ncbi:MAG TPA: threonine/serine dehydratase, partial [Thermopetrobacter sp.]|nr:threonine/serine dehydratase [Thermopetrobacter sp.]